MPLRRGITRHPGPTGLQICYRKIFPDARVLTWGYDADVVGFLQPVGRGRISNHAEMLVNDVVGERSRSNIKEDRPIIFVSHSLGGLVTEMALTVSKGSLDERLHIVEKGCLGIVFLGTPHAGADLATTLSKLGHLSLGTVHRDILAVLQPGSEMLRQVERNFLILCHQREQERRRLKIACCWEELEVPGIGFVSCIWRCLKSNPSIPC